MKKLKSGEEIPARVYYYLLDWRDNNPQRWNKFCNEFIREKFTDWQVSELNADDCWNMFYHVTNVDLKEAGIVT